MWEFFEVLKDCLPLELTSTDREIQESNFHFLQKNNLQPLVQAAGIHCSLSDLLTLFDIEVDLWLSSLNFFLFVWVLGCTYICIPWTKGGQKRVEDPKELELQKVSYDVGTDNRT